MRLDKFLKVSRLIKRRTVAKEMADKGRIKINQVVGKSSSVVKLGDELAISYGNKELVVQIDRIEETTKKELAKEMYHILSENYKNVGE
ncbi:RNA-binding S4 domain-containing protein [Isobaculum melis]|uniref:RQC P-site tRNA stabilizing factor n=1 Tax=Isobaculum melis TaxID=142588 RepID=A0A1H9SMH3_9LACT|nr:RNA-binding S4 domain-containing protein [Isobaculum melis]SER86186.1 Ribosomal 50S subunit-recycling heat shock protein, contains S4 domain [Isobaculum melis]